jgi:hypothetical protein
LSFILVGVPEGIDRRRILGIGDLADWLEKEKWIGENMELRRRNLKNPLEFRKKQKRVLNEVK